jgi:hypothetical protein
MYWVDVRNSEAEAQCQKPTARTLTLKATLAPAATEQQY